MEAIQYSSNKNDECVTQKEMHRISLKLSRQQYRLLARELELTDQKIDDIVAHSTLNMYGDEEVVYNILRLWRETKGKAATRSVLKNALTVIGRKDLADEIYSDLWQCDPEKIKTHYIGLQVHIEEIQTKVYQEVELPQVNWTDRILPLEELYVNLELMKTVDDYEGTMVVPMQLEELFNQINGKDPLRILIEGGPGYGKTTLCYKLLNDWGRNRNYIRSKFKMVFLFELRYFEESDSIEEMLKSECKEIDVNGDDGITCIEAFQNETLLILDGFDEMDDEGKEKVLSLIQKKKYPSMFVVVTSRRGMFRKDESGQGIKIGGGLKKTLQNVNKKNLWNKRVLNKGVTTDKIETFMLKYFNKDFKNSESKIQHIIRGEMVKVFECPLFLILLAMLLEEKTFKNVNSKTKLYMEFFNFIIRRNLIREKKISDEEEIDIFDASDNHSKLVQLIKQLGRLAIEHLCENKLMFQEKVVLEYCKDKLIFHLGFLTKIPQREGRRKENFYQPIHKSFLEFIGAHSLWNLFQTDENQFKGELERIVKRGLKPTDDSLFFVFLGGFMNSKAYVLFQFLTPFAYWFNIESICFTNILLEIKNISSFFQSFEPILDSFIPPVYSIDGFKGLTEDYFHSEIHSLILKYACDQQLIKVLRWNSAFSFNVSCDLYVDRLFLSVSDKIYKICPKGNEASVKCKNIFCHFSEYFDVVKWNDFVSLFDWVESEKVNLFFGSKSNEISSVVLELLHNELIEGQWKQRNINQIIFALNDFENPQSVSLLEDLVKKNRLIEAISVSIYPSEKRTEEKRKILKRETEKLFDAVMKCKTFKDIYIFNTDFNFSPRLKFNGIVNPCLKSLVIIGSFSLFISNEKKIESFSVEELAVHSPDNDMKLNFIQNIQDTKFLSCELLFFNSLVETSWSGLQELQELELDIQHVEQLQFLNSLSQLKNMEVFTLAISQLQTIPTNSKLLFISLFSSLSLRICQLNFVNPHQSFSFLIEALMEGLKNKEKHYSTTVSNEGKKVQLQELAIIFIEQEMDLNEMKDSKEVQWIQLMLRSKLLEECCWISFNFKDYNYYKNIKSNDFENLFPSNEKFRITYELYGINPNRSRLSQIHYRWFMSGDMYCIKFVDE